MNAALHPRNTNSVWLRGLTDDATGLPVNDATVTWEVRTAAYPDGTVVDDGSGTYVTASSGDYHCDIDASLAIEAGTTYFRRVMAEDTNGSLGDWEDSFKAVRRTGRTPTT